MLELQLDDITENVRYITATPVLTYCRQLMDDGVEPDTEVHVYRGDILAIKVRKLGEAAKLTVQDNKYGTPVFRPYLPKNTLQKGVAEPVHSLNS